MSVPRPLVATLFVALAALGVFSSLPADARTGPCTPPHSVTIAANEQVRVYRDRAQLDRARVVACHRRTGSKTRLGSPFADTPYQFGGRRAIALRGSTVAYTMIIDPLGDEGGPSTSLVRVQLPFVGDRAFGSAPAVSLNISDSSPGDLAVERIFIAESGTVILAACEPRALVYRGCARPLGKVRIVAAPDSGLPARPAVPRASGAGQCARDRSGQPAAVALGHPRRMEPSWAADVRPNSLQRDSQYVGEILGFATSRGDPLCSAYLAGRVDQFLQVVGDADSWMQQLAPRARAGPQAGPQTNLYRMLRAAGTGVWAA